MCTVHARTGNCLHCGFEPRLRQRGPKRCLASHPLASFCTLLPWTTVSSCAISLLPVPVGPKILSEPHTVWRRVLLGLAPPCAAWCTRERDRVLHCVYFAWARMKRCVTDACPPDASRSRALPCLLLQSASVVTLGVARRVNQRAPLHVLRSSTTPAR